ncbi:hypothetical protein CNMCM5623_009862 [Aspergillus felis]|uniref:Uncharacterized protein n=1 Tax=Aspergillus felis TaxID=1287682 RepID=A0A8H6QK62_9EURO|nr:hypothetical protein CNMCM5623_009862 [Aspergillus felis]KAF7184897.1 hypothetical protein CNMCM7691_009297 [Aspergillus felis]
MRCKLPSLGCEWHTSPSQVRRCTCPDGSDCASAETAGPPAPTQKIPVLCFSKQEVAARRLLGCALTRS